MPIEVPNLDDQDFEAILAEALRRIPVHTPEWTNYAVESDPGTTLVQLFAFIAENINYRANRVPEKNRLQFLQLLGLGLQPAVPAEGLVAVTNERGALDPVALDEGARFGAGDVRFASLEPLNVLPVESLVVVKQEPESGADAVEAEEVTELYAELDRALNLNSEQSYSFYHSIVVEDPTPTDPAPEVVVAETVGRSVYVALLAREGAGLDDVRAAIGGETLHLGTAPASAAAASSVGPRPLSEIEEPRAQLAVQLWNGNVKQPGWRPLSTSSRVDLLENPGVIQVLLPPAPELPSWSFDEAGAEGKGALPPLVQDEALAARIVAWLRVRPIGGNDTDEGLDWRLRWMGVNAVPVRQSVRVADELVGTATGEPDQVFQLAHGPVHPEGIIVATKLGASPRELWRPTKDLVSEGPEDFVFELDPEARTLAFGDGQRGRRPAVGARVLVTYTYGGGAQGNVGIGKVESSPELALQGGFAIANPLPMVGGGEAESTADGERGVAASVRHRDRLVTVEDFRDIAARTPGVDVARVEVLPLFDPGSGDNRPGAVSVVVVPEAAEVFPSPDSTFLSTICRHLEPRRLVTTELHVLGPDYVDLSIAVGIQVRSGKSRELVKDAVRAALLSYLAPAGEDGPEGNGWPLYREVLALELEAVAARVPGVRLVQEFKLGDGAGTAIDAQLTLTGAQLPRVIAIGVQEGSAEDLPELLDATGDVLTDEPVGIPVIPKTC